MKINLKGFCALKGGRVDLILPDGIPRKEILLDVDHGESAPGPGELERGFV